MSEETVQNYHSSSRLRHAGQRLRKVAREASVLGAVMLGFALVGCVSIPERNSLPPDLMNQAAIPGVPDARFWGDEWPKFSLERFEGYTTAEYKANFSGVYDRSHHYLAISGGGANGAFGGGLLAGWTASGNRPEFTMVTGVSTGALSAPFAFLGSDYDDELKAVFTTTTTSDIMTERSILSAPWSDSMADTKPLRKLLEHYITEEMVQEIAIEHRRGRRLFIGTANLDAGRGVIWNLGAIAGSDYPRKMALIHDVLQASAAIPVAFPPVVIPVEANGRLYDEMHVDGGTASQVFVYPAAIDWRKVTEKLKVKGKPHVYVIRNAFLEPDYRGITRSLLPIAGRSIDSLIRTQGIGDLYQIHSLCIRDGNDFNLAFIPSDFTEEPSEAFDPVYMGLLWERGYQMALTGYPWKKEPPGLATAR
ncbi:MAG: patatin-like phospholipase family protein [Gemmatimonadetes bacterium]|nr:patatin-like phospholipase family protein [Gemmatimonadota bacterium]